MRAIALLFAVVALTAEAPPPHYRIDATLGPERDELRATAHISFEPDPSEHETRFILGRSFHVDSAVARGADVGVEETEQPFPGALQAVVVKPRAGTRRALTLDLEYSGKLMALQQPPMNSITPNLIELTVDSMWLPYPADLTRRLTAEADFSGIPDNALVVSTGGVSKVGGRVHVSLRRRSDLSLIASPDLHELKEGRFRFIAADPNSSLMKVYRTHGPKALSMMERIFGTVPVDALRVTAVKRANPAGYNRPGYIVVADRITHTPDAALAMSLAHEIAHNWFFKANFLSEDYWLLEAPAEYLGLRYGEEAFGQAALQPYLAREERRAQAGGAILGHGRPGDDAAYGRGSMLLRSLERRIGTPKMDALLVAVSRQPTHTTAGFLAALNKIAGREVARDFGISLRAAEYRPLS